MVPCIITKLLNLVNIFLKVHGTNVKFGGNTDTYVDNTARNKRASISASTVISLNRNISINRFRELGFVVGIPQTFINSGKLSYVYNVGAKNYQSQSWIINWKN